jgi:hypothetical protein
MEKRHTVFGGLRVLDDGEKLQNIGSAIVKEAIARAILRKTKTGALRNSLTIKKGEFVPASFAQQLKIQVDAEGRALANWPANLEDGDYFEVCYEDSDKGYCDCWPDAPDIEKQYEYIAQERIENLAGVTKVALEKNFSAEDIRLLKSYGLIR